MDSLDLQTRVELVKLYYAQGNSATACLRRHKTAHQLHDYVCSESTVRRLIARFESTGSVMDLQRSGRPQVGDQTVEKVASTMVELQTNRPSGSASTQDVATALNLPRSTVRNILRQYLKWRPYRMHIVQHLKDIDLDTRKQFANSFLAHLSFDANFLATVFWSDEANFYLDTGVFTHQCVIWSPDNPHVAVEKTHFPSHVTVWCGFTSKFIVGPFFFEGNVTGQKYLAMLQDFLIPALKRHRALHNVTFQQDGAAPHVTAIVKEFLSETFGTRIISRGFPQFWPPRSPDLAPNDYWLWGALKGKVYASQPHTLEDLKASIQMEIEKIPPSELQSAINNLPHRLRAVLEQDGGHFEHYF